MTRKMNSEGGKQAGEGENAPTTLPFKEGENEKTIQKAAFPIRHAWRMQKKEMPNDRRRRT